MNKNLYMKRFELFVTAREKMYEFDPYALKLIKNATNNDKVKENLLFYKDLENVFHDIQMIQDWIYFTIVEFQSYSNAKGINFNSSKKPIPSKLFLEFLEDQLYKNGLINRNKITVVKKLLTINQLMNQFLKGEPFLDVPGVDATREINGLQTKIKHSAFPHLLQFHYLLYCSKKYSRLSVVELKRMLQLFGSDQQILEEVYIPLFDNVGIQNNFTNPHYVSNLARTFFCLPSNYHEFLYSDLATKYFGKKLPELKAIEEKKKATFVLYIFPRDMKENTIAPEFKEDANTVISLNAEYIIFNIELFIRSVDNNLPLDACFVHFDKYFFPVTGVYRSYIICTDYYRILYNYLKKHHNIILLNTPKESKNAHLIPNWKDKLGRYFSDTYCIKFDPKSESIQDLLCILKDNQEIPKQKYILKDFHKSEKDHWESCSLIDLRTSKQKLKKQIEQFLYWRGRNFEGGICLRMFVDYPIIKPIDNENLFPSLREYRVYILNGEIIYFNKRYPQLSYEIKLAKINNFFNNLDLKTKIKTTFYAVDIVLTDHNELEVIELDDAQFCGIFESKFDFYDRLNKSILENKRLER